MTREEFDNYLATIDVYTLERVFNPVDAQPAIDRLTGDVAALKAAVAAGQSLHDQKGEDEAPPPSFDDYIASFEGVNKF